MKVGNPKYAEYLGFIYRVIIYLKEFSAKGWESGCVGSITFKILVNNTEMASIDINYDEYNETDVYVDKLINPIPIKPKDKIEIELEKNPPSGVEFIVDGINIKLKCSKIPT